MRLTIEREGLAALVMFGKIHNAKVCTIDGRDHFVATLYESGGRIVDVDGFDSLDDARAWLAAEGRRRCGEEIKIEVE